MLRWNNSTPNTALDLNSTFTSLNTKMLLLVLSLFLCFCWCLLRRWWLVGLFIGAVSYHLATAWSVCNKPEIMWNKTFAAILYTPSWYLPGRNEENHEKLQDSRTGHMTAKHEVGVLSCQGWQPAITLPFVMVWLNTIQVIVPLEQLEVCGDFAGRSHNFEIRGSMDPATGRMWQVSFTALTSNAGGN
jgi:hypothetical protein